MGIKSIFVLVLLLWLFSFLYLRYWLNRRTRPERLFKDYADEIERMIANIDAATERDALLIEERVKSLKALLENVDRRLSLLLKETEKIKPLEATPAQAAPYQAAPSQTAPAQTAPDKAVPIATPLVKRAKIQLPEAELSLLEKIKRLYKRGLDSSEIAKELAVAVAEVELAIALFQAEVSSQTDN